MAQRPRNPHGNAPFVPPGGAAPRTSGIPYPHGASSSRNLPLASTSRAAVSTHLPKKKAILSMDEEARKETISRKLGSWESMAIEAITGNESLPRTRLRLQQELAALTNSGPNAPPFSIPTAPSNSHSTSPSLTQDFGPIYANVPGLTWEQYEERARKAQQKSEEAQRMKKAEEAKRREEGSGRGASEMYASSSRAGRSTRDVARSGNSSGKRKGEAPARSSHGDFSSFNGGGRDVAMGDLDLDLDADEDDVMDLDPELDAPDATAAVDGKKASPRQGRKSGGSGTSGGKDRKNSGGSRRVPGGGEGSAGGRRR